MADLVVSAFLFATLILWGRMGAMLLIRLEKSL